MATSYPGGYDSFDEVGPLNLRSDSVGGRDLRDFINDHGDAIEALEAENGLNPSGTDATVAARLTAIEAGTNLAVLGHHKTRTAPRTGLYTPGTSGHYASAPYAAGLAITGDIDLRWIGSLDDWTPAATTALVARFYNDAGSRNFAFTVMDSPAGYLQLTWSADGTTTLTATSTAATGFTNGAIGGVRVTLDVNNGAAGHTATFYTSSDEGASWTQLGSAVTTAGTTSIWSDSSTILEIGGYSNGASLPIAGRSLRAEVRNGIAGTVVASPDFQRGTIGKDAQGNPWTIVGASSKLTDDSGNTVTTHGSYTDETLGRRIFTWDDYNLRWQMTYGDTGSRDLSAVSLSNGWTVGIGVFRLRRVGNVVNMMAAFDGSAASAATVYTIPAGFRPSTYSWHSVPFTTAASTTRMCEIDTGAFKILNYGAGTHYVNLTWLTPDSWPTSLPGSASGSIPT